MSRALYVCVVFIAHMSAAQSFELRYYLPVCLSVCWRVKPPPRLLHPRASHGKWEIHERKNQGICWAIFQLDQSDWQQCQTKKRQCERCQSIIFALMFWLECDKKKGVQCKNAKVERRDEWWWTVATRGAKTRTSSGEVNDVKYWWW